MAPSDDNNHDNETSSVKMTDEVPSASTTTSTTVSQVKTETANDSLKNIAFAINYELPMVNQFLAVHHDSRRKSLSNTVEICTKSTQHNNNRPDLPPSSSPLPIRAKPKKGRRITSNMENYTPSVLDKSVNDSRMESQLSSLASVEEELQSQQIGRAHV